MTGLSKEMFGALRQLRSEAKVQGFDILKIEGQRALSSTSANPGKLIDITIDLTK